MRYVSRGLLAVVTAVAAIAVMLTTAFAAAPTPHTDAVSGIEYSATAIEGKFAGYATGDLPGLWNADVVHEDLSKTATPMITGGSFTVVSGQTVTGTFTGGKITPRPAQGCNQTFDVVGDLTNVGGHRGTGTFAVALTHYGFPSGGRCITYAASVSGSVVLNF
jgi:hypothetical protein